LLAVAAIPILLLHRSSLHEDGHAAPAAANDVVLHMQRGDRGNEFEPGAIGLSIEAQELAGSGLSAHDSSLVELMRLLGPGVLRIGGDSLDESWWTSQNEPAPAWATSTITPADLGRLRELLEAAGWRAILGVNLGHFDPARAAGEALVAEHVLGPHLLGLEIGNEPSNYGNPDIGLRSSSYSVGEYLHELAAYSTAIRSAVPGIALYGPDLGSFAPLSWLQAVASDKGASFTSLDVHYYPTHYSVAKGACAAAPMPSPGELLSPEVREAENEALKSIHEAGQVAHLPTRISETNDSSSCDLPGAPSISPVFASALWSLDWALRAASAGVAGINFHGNFGRCIPEAFTPVCEPRHVAAARAAVTARPEYYGLLAARELEGGRFVPTHLSSSGSLPNLTSYATVGSSGTIRIAIDNMALEGPAETVSIPASGYTASYQVLAGPSLTARSEITLAHAGLTAAGQWHPRRMSPSRVGRWFRVMVQPASAVIVKLKPKSARR
jgi:hypothetical protein